jgi:TetR/AcrR family transcriptional regulator, cholesterol catabolism regulator
MTAKQLESPDTTPPLGERAPATAGVPRSSGSAVPTYSRPMNPTRGSRAPSGGRTGRKGPKPPTASVKETDDARTPTPEFLIAPKARGRPEPVSRFPEIINLSAELFRSQGFAETSIEDVANAAGILKGSLYHYINTKEDLLFAIIDEIYVRTDVKFQRVQAFEGDVASQLGLFIDLHMEDTGDLAAKVAVFTTEYRSLPEDRREQVQQRRDAYEELLHRLITKGQQEQVFLAHLDARITAIGILQMLNGTYKWYVPEGTRTMEEITRDFKRIIFRGILVDHGALTAEGDLKH